MKDKKLKLFVWEDVLYDYTPGIMVAYAYDVDHARKLIKAKDSCVDKHELNQEPREIKLEEAIVLWGGG